MVSIGEAIGEKEVFSLYADKMLSYTQEYTGNDGILQTIPRFDGLTIVQQHLDGAGISKADGIAIIDKRHTEIFRLFI